MTLTERKQLRLQQEDLDAKASPTQEWHTQVEQLHATTPIVFLVASPVVFCQ